MSSTVVPGPLSAEAKKNCIWETKGKRTTYWYKEHSKKTIRISPLKYEELQARSEVSKVKTKNDCKNVSKKSNKTKVKTAGRRKNRIQPVQPLLGVSFDHSPVRQPGVTLDHSSVLQSGVTLDHSPVRQSRDPLTKVKHEPKTDRVEDPIPFRLVLNPRQYETGFPKTPINLDKLPKIFTVGPNNKEIEHILGYIAHPSLALLRKHASKLPKQANVQHSTFGYIRASVQTIVEHNPRSLIQVDSNFRALENSQASQCARLTEAMQLFQKHTRGVESNLDAIIDMHIGSGYTVDQDGYVRIKEDTKNAREIEDDLENDHDLQDDLMQNLNITVHTNTSTRNHGHLISYAYCATIHADKLPLGFYPCNLAQLLLLAAYEATLLAAVLNLYSGGSPRVYLTTLGSDNQPQLVKAAIEAVLPQFDTFGLEIFFLDPAPRKYQQWGQDLAASKRQERGSFEGGQRNSVSREVRNSREKAIRRGPAERAFKDVRNSHDLRVRIADGSTRVLTDTENYHFNKLRQGLVVDNVFGGLLASGRLLVDKSSDDNNDHRDEKQWWKTTKVEDMRVWDNVENRLSKPNKKQKDDYSAFLEYNEFPLRALTLKPGFIRISEEVKLLYRSSKRARQVQLVSVGRLDYLDVAEANMKNLFAAYTKGYGFPIDQALKLLNKYHEYMEPTRVFYRQGSKLEDVKKLTMEREPANINMKRHYRADFMKSTFGWERGAYEHMVNPPNIAIYTYTQVIDEENTYHNVHMLHAIGLAFDNEEQPDYKKYMAMGAAERQREVIQFYQNLFHTVFQVCMELNISSLVMSKVGAQNFAKMYYDNDINQGDVDQFQTKVWWPTWKRVKRQYPDILNIEFMGLGNSAEDKQQTDVGHFPACVKHSPDSLFVNSWDCWSIVGNGNSYNQSLNGFVGRCSSAAVSAWPMTNMYMTEQSYIELH